MTDVHATNGSGQSHEAVSSVSRSSAPWLAEGVSRATYYRRRQSNKSENPEIKSDIPPAPEPELKSEAQPELNKPETSAVEQKPTAQEYQEKIIPEADAATQRLKDQLAALEQSQQLHQQYQAQPVRQAPVTREGLLDQWRREGMSDANLKFLTDNPELVDGWQLTVHAAHEATQRGHQLDTDVHREATREIFHHYLAEAEKQMAINNPPAGQPTPQFFEPPPAPRPRQEPSRRSIVSAPVSREPIGGYQHELNDPSKVHLRPEHREAARIAGVSELEYAKQLLKLRELKALGEYGGEPQR